MYKIRLGDYTDKRYSRFYLDIMQILKNKHIQYSYTHAPDILDSFFSFTLEREYNDAREIIVEYMKN